MLRGKCITFQKYLILTHLYPVQIEKKRGEEKEIERKREKMVASRLVYRSFISNVYERSCEALYLKSSHVVRPRKDLRCCLNGAGPR